VKQHLDSLQGAGLVELNDEGRKWKYYSLTHEAKSLTSPYINEVRIVFPISVILIFLGFTMLQTQAFYATSQVLEKGATADHEYSGPLLPEILMGLGALLLLLCVFLLAKRRFGRIPEKIYKQ
jgi:DNA-binding transcriptional ArsR family regulator